MTDVDSSGSSVTVPARHARGLRVPAGRTVVVRDVAGGQVGDLFAFNAEDPSECLSASHTRSMIRRLFPSVGESFGSSLRRPMLTLVADTSPGIHDMLIAACDPERYRLLGVTEPHRNCAENLRSAAREFGFEPSHIPQPVNLFMNTPPVDGGIIDYRVSPSRAGDAVTLRAEMDVIVIVSACPMDIVTISDGDLTDLEMELSS